MTCIDVYCCIEKQMKLFHWYNIQPGLISLLYFHTCSIFTTRDGRVQPFFESSRVRVIFQWLRVESSQVTSLVESSRVESSQNIFVNFGCGCGSGLPGVQVTNEVHQFRNGVRVGYNSVVNGVHS
jgi:hypothetical protein